MSDLASREFKRAPTRFLEEMRRESPLISIKMPLIGSVRLTTTHAATDEMLKDRSRFVSNPATAGIDARQLPRWLPKRVQILAKNMLLYDEPDHRRLRSRIDKAFARRGVLEMRPALEAQTDLLLDKIEPEGFDVVSSLARPLPLTAICELLGLRQDDHAAFEKLAAPLSGGGSTFSILLGIWRLGGLLDFIRERIAAARAGDDEWIDPSGMLAALATAEEGDGAALDEDELLALILTLLVAGHETTTHLISGGLWALLSHPEQLARLRSGEVSIEDAVEELLRWLTPVMATKARFAAEDTTIEGAKIARGERVTGCLIAANHDPARWDAPEELRLDRKPAGHLAFGAGIHFCVGLNLARLEAQVAIGRLLLRFPNLLLTEQPLWGRRPGLRGIERLRLTGA